MPAALDIQPRLMPAPVAARYLGVSTTKLSSLGIPRKVSNGNRLYDRADLDAYADALPYEKVEKGNTCDGAFGIAS